LRRITAKVSANAPPLSIVLDVDAVRETVTVTSEPGLAQDATRAVQPVTVISREHLDQRAHNVVAEAVTGESGVHLQRTSPSMAGVFVRGLTGNKVNVYVDGVRYSNGAQRGGVNTFLNLLDQSSIDGIEVVHGPNSAEYGSDALGGTVQFIPARRRWRRPSGISAASSTSMAGRPTKAAAPAVRCRGAGGHSASTGRSAAGKSASSSPATASTRTPRSRVSWACPRRC
jgi:outer membrane receptor for ferrienterochelin and colicin